MEVFRQESVSTTDEFLFFFFAERYFRVFAHESCIKVDTTLHGVHTSTVAFSPSVLIKRSICSYHQTMARTLHEWLKKTIHGI